MARWLTALILALTLLITGCAPTPPSPYEQVQQESTQRNAPPAVSREATQGSEFNRFFPPEGNGFERIYVQEKKGFAEAKLKKEGKELAMLAISDTISTPEAAAKFQNSTMQIAGYPAVEVGTTQTAILVANRYQVKVLSRDPSFTASDRREWIEKFDLAGLAQLAP
ncbi:hypothetical protein QYC27_03260 [Thermosynechococcus sp. PP45]|uniref:hypothetical protein n=1 Tax=unclassified Thermosynechococcus TaxID=2622553 RepID=UPI002673E499|nr:MULTISPECIES: hypothetical protein [unclassified Thermosynechococcus]WKT81834.1 hypothetical protein QYC27_03260 [Thermosynechococcus sp. PP45]WNC25446.1 hypothetical protein RHH26_03260 [Thermosynechococcus sp. PP551]WNC28025.1 hypothetical protein RHH27_03260 [Thermosynechococcus sp. PP555]